MPYNDLRAFLDKLRSERELSEIEAEVDWNLEIGAISRRALDLRSPALLFRNVKGYSLEHRVLSNLMGPSKPVVQGRVALAMDLPKDTPTLKVIDEFAERSQRTIKPRLVSTAPCKENVLMGDDVDLFQFPAPFFHGTDGGRYFGTWHICVVRDPDSEWVNWGTYRMMLHDRNRLGWLAHPGQHGPATYYQKYEARGKAMPMAVAIGAEPVCHIVATSPFPPRLSEVDAAGGIRGEPVDLVKCETIDLEVPASAEMVLEGEVMPCERELEGEFGEYTGYCAANRAPRPVFHVRCVTYRNSPIFCVDAPGIPWDVTAVLGSVAHSALVANDLRKLGIDFKSVYVPPPTMAIIVSVPRRYPGYAHSVASAVWSTKSGLYRPYLFIVGDDVDVTNTDEVMWCLTTRLHPGRGIHVEEHAPSHPLFPFLSASEKNSRLGAKVAFDATFPAEWPPEEVPTIVDLQHAWPREVRRKVLERWNEYGIE